MRASFEFLGQKLGGRRTRAPQALPHAMALLEYFENKYHQSSNLQGSDSLTRASDWGSLNDQ